MVQTNFRSYPQKIQGPNVGTEGLRVGRLAPKSYYTGTLCLYTNT